MRIVPDILKGLYKYLLDTHVKAKRGHEGGRVLRKKEQKHEPGKV